MDAAPFRAHVRHVLATADVPWPVFATASGVPVPALRTLLFGRHGRRLTRLEPSIAARLLQTSPSDLAYLRRAQVDAEVTVTRLRTLLAAGHDPVELRRWCELEPTAFHHLINGHSVLCSRLTESLALAAERMAAAPARQQRAA